MNLLYGDMRAYYSIVKNSHIDFFVFVLVFLFLSLFPFEQELFAWGPGAHTLMANSVLLGSVDGILSKLISNFQIQFLWGNILADIVIGKNLSNWKIHPHNFSYVLSIFDRCRTDKVRAFMVGYMNHLSHDIVAHNFMIPEIMLAEVFTENKRLQHNSKFFHVKIELEAEKLVPLEIWKKIKFIQSSPEVRECTEFLEENITGTLISSAKANVKIYLSTLKINIMKEFIRSKMKLRIRNGNNIFSSVIHKYLELSVRLSERFLSEFTKSRILEFDPTGIEPICIAEELRKSVVKVRRREKEVSCDRYFTALRQFQPSIFGNRTPVLDILNFS